MAGLHDSRVSTAPDTQGLGAAVGFPGIDPRVWVSLARVLEFVVDPDHGVFVEVLVYYDGSQHTARLATPYAGDGWGLYMPLHVDDEVTVGYPHGCPDDGLTVLGRSWSAADKPPKLVQDNQNDVVLVVEPGHSLRMQVAGGGEVHIAGGKIVLNDGTDENAVVRKHDAITASSPTVTWATAVETAINILAPLTFTPANSFAGALPANPGAANNLGTNTQGSDTVKAGG